MRHAPLTTLCFLALCGLTAGCGQESAADASSDDSAPSAAPDALDGRAYAGSGVVGETWIDGTVVGEGAPGTLAAQLPRSYDDFGARIDGDTLVVRLPGPDGVDFEIRRETGEVPIPGAVALDLQPDGASVRALIGEGGLADVDRGSVTVSDCPSGLQGAVRGALRDVVLEGDGRTWRLNLDFRVVVVAAAGDLVCGTGERSDDQGDDQERTCRNTLCEDRSFGCCPYEECLDQCELTTCRSLDCEGDPASCKHRCRLGCIEQCGIVGDCLVAAEALWGCQLDGGCFDDGANEDSCTREQCCDEFTAAY